MWKPSLQDFQNLFSNEHSLKILCNLYLKKNQRATATDISEILGIHVSTAKKYLELLFEVGFVNKEIIEDKPGKPTYFAIKQKEISILLNLEQISKSENEYLEASDIYLREKPDLHPRVTYQMDYGMIKEINVKLKTKAKKLITFKIILNSIEKIFMKYLPLPSEEPKKLIKICYIAEIHSKPDIKLIESFVQKLKKYNIIEIS